MTRTAPLFRPDPGWLFTIAGLAVMVAAALLPAERDLHELRQQMAALEVREAYNAERLAAYDRFMRELAQHDPALIRRLAASQLNLMPEGEQPLLMATSIEHTVSDWIEATVESPAFTPLPPPDTLLTRLADGSRRLWLMGGGAMVVFLGLVMGFGVSPRPSVAVGPHETDFVREVEAAGERGDSEPASEVEPDTGSSLLAACEAACVELPFENADVDDPEATAEPLEQEAFEWPEAVAPFEAGEAESGASVDASIASAWRAEADDMDAPAGADRDDGEWMRDHGSD